MTKRLYIIPCVFIISLGAGAVCFGGGWQFGDAGCPGSCRPWRGEPFRFACTPGYAGYARPEHAPGCPAADRCLALRLRVWAGLLCRHAPWLPLATRAGAQALADKAVFQENSTRQGAPGLGRAGEFSLASVQPGVTVDLVYERLYGQLQPGDVVTVVRLRMAPMGQPRPMEPVSSGYAALCGRWQRSSGGYRWRGYSGGCTSTGHWKLRWSPRRPAGASTC